MWNLKLFVIGILTVGLFFVNSDKVCASNSINMHALITSDFSTDNLPDEIQIKNIKKVNISDDIEIPQRSIITAEVFQAQKEKRWHKSGFVICKVKSYLIETESEPVDVSDKNLYIVARKYEKADKKDIAITSTEIVLSQAASLFAPGVDLLYFFTKGAIMREKNPNWFKAGVSNAYDNSICWFWLKGKPIELSEGEEIKIKNIKKAKADKIKTKCLKYQAKQDLKAQRNEERALHKHHSTSSVASNDGSASSEDVAAEISADIVIATIEKSVSSSNELISESRNSAILADIIDEYTNGFSR